MRRARYICIYFFAYLAIGALCPLIGKYLEDEGYHGVDIGIVTSLGTVSAIFASILWGRVYAACRKGNLIVAFLSFAASVMCMELLKVENLEALVLVYALMYFFQAPVLALVDAMCSQDNKDFGIFRMWGAVGYASGAFFAGRGVEGISYEVIFYIYSASYCFCGMTILFLKNRNIIPIKEKQTERKGYTDILKNRRFVRLLCAFFFFGGTNVANNTYYGFMYTDCGGTIGGMSICMLIMILSEAPFMALAKFFSDRFTIEKMLLLAMVASAVRFGAYALEPPLPIICMLGVLQGVANGIALVEVIRYIGMITKKSELGLATSVYYAVASNMSTIACQFIGGLVLNSFGGCSVYLFFAAYNLIGIIYYVCFGLHKRVAANEANKDN